ncbi:hypothetical protein ACWDSJ_28075 [Nocardia sp. NPDC003482]
MRNSSRSWRHAYTPTQLALVSALGRKRDPQTLQQLARRIGRRSTGPVRQSIKSLITMGLVELTPVEGPGVGNLPETWALTVRGRELFRRIAADERAARRARAERRRSAQMPTLPGNVQTHRTAAAAAESAQTTESAMWGYSGAQVRMVAALGDAPGPRTLAELVGDRPQSGVRQTVTRLIEQGLVKPVGARGAAARHFMLTKDGRALYERIALRRRRQAAGKPPDIPTETALPTKSVAPVAYPVRPGLAELPPVAAAPVVRIISSEGTRALIAHAHGAGYRLTRDSQPPYYWRLSEIASGKRTLAARSLSHVEAWLDA